ncbi:hypothetical protein [Synechococcus sp. MIT S1220]|uniref:hypothetical protein n=1 Tax=Synechococcus sp. MIT S1220 TaxID=3082549 RepID=UPI0039B0303C
MAVASNRTVSGPKKAAAVVPPWRNDSTTGGVQKLRARSADDDKCTGREWTLRAPRIRTNPPMARPIQHLTS